MFCVYTIYSKLLVGYNQVSIWYFPDLVYCCENVQLSNNNNNNIRKVRVIFENSTTRFQHLSSKVHCSRKILQRTNWTKSVCHIITEMDSFKALLRSEVRYTTRYIMIIWCVTYRSMLLRLLAQFVSLYCVYTSLCSCALLAWSVESTSHIICKVT